MELVYLSYSDLCISLNCSCLSLAKRLEVGNIVVDVLDGEGKDLDAHPSYIRGSDLHNLHPSKVKVLALRMVGAVVVLQELGMLHLGHMTTSKNLIMGWHM